MWPSDAVGCQVLLNALNGKHIKEEYQRNYQSKSLKPFVLPFLYKLIISNFFIKKFR